jgi:hypothetical protein
VITIGIVLAVVLGSFAVLRQAESKPGLCPRCGLRTLLADRSGLEWRCVPCQAQYIYFNGRLLASERTGPHGEEAIPTATLRKPDDD